MKFKNTLKVISLALLLSAVQGCGDDKKTDEHATHQAHQNHPSELTTVRIGYLPSPGHLLYFLAKEEGFFEEEGINAELVLFNENNSELAAMESGKIDVGAYGSSELVSYMSEGHKISLFAGAMKTGHGIIVKERIVKGIPKSEWSIKLLAGKKIGVEGIGSGHIVIREALKKLGLDKDTEFVMFNDGSDVYASLKNDEIDAAVLYAPYRILAENEGYTILANSGDVEGFDNHVCCRQAILTDKLKAEPETYKHFIRALIKAYKFYKTNESQSIKDIAKYVDVDEDLLLADTYKYDNEIANPDPDLKRMDVFYDSLVDLGFVKEFDIKPNYTAALYEQALNELVKENANDAVYKELYQYHQRAN